jgi:hypothetical protein
MQDRIDFAAIRSSLSLASFCASRGIVLHREGSNLLVGRCPLHDEKSGSFTVYPDQHFYCYGCGRHGDVTHLCAAMDGIPLGEAARKLNQGASPPLIYALPSPVAVAPKPEPYQLSKGDRKRMATAAHRLATDPFLISKLVAKRPEWTADAIQGAALEGDLGFEPDCRFTPFSGPAILFAYSHGIKARWKDRFIKGKKKHAIRWICGRASGQLWRQSLLLDSHRVIYIDEGETDALTVIGFGVEEPGESLVLALAGASMMPQPEPFDGRNVVIIPDPGQPGDQAQEKLRGLLQPFAKSIRAVPLRETVQ